MERVQKVTIKQLVDGLTDIPAEEFTIERVADFLRWKQIDSASLQPYVYWQDSHYTRNLIYKNDLFELIGFCWEIGQGAPIHSHNQQYCWMIVQEGTLSVTNYHMIRCDIDQNRLPVGVASGVNTVELVQTTQFPLRSVGMVTWADKETEIHSVINLPEFHQRAISVHVYSRPFDSCMIYDLVKRQCQRIPLSYYSTYGKKCHDG
jgi:cysteine dioxygenase